MTKTDLPFVTQSSDIEMQEIKAGKNAQMQVLIGPSIAPNFSMRKFVMQPGGGMPKHTNQVEHQQYVVRGEATITIGEQSYNVKQGDVVYIPKGVPHSYRTSGSEAFEFLCIVPNSADKIQLMEPSGC